jgi:thiamine kinase-like enzyme
MQPALQGYDQLELVASGWKKRLPSFEEELKKIPELSNVDLSQLGERLERVAKKVGAKAHPFHGTSDVTSEFSPYRTFIHGDPKQANIFLRESSHIDGERIEVGLIDFQWSGFGLAATDVAHHICAAVQPNCLSCDGTKEKELLDYYYSCLTRALVKFGTATSVVDVEERVFPRQVFQEQYEVALLDICRMVFAYAWRRWQAESQPTAASFNRNAYNKSLPSAVWLIARCSTLLSARENDLLRDDGDDIQ